MVIKRFPYIAVITLCNQTVIMLFRIYTKYVKVIYIMPPSCPLRLIKYIDEFTLFHEGVMLLDLYTHSYIGSLQMQYMIVSCHTLHVHADYYLQSETCPSNHHLCVTIPWIQHHRNCPATWSYFIGIMGHWHLVGMTWPVLSCMAEMVTDLTRIMITCQIVFSITFFFIVYVSSSFMVRKDLLSSSDSLSLL